MKLHTWTAEISAELRQAGFDVKEWNGLPLVAMPESHEQRVKLLKFQASLAADRKIYREGMIFIPVALRAGRTA